MTTEPMTPEEFARRMRENANGDDEEVDHKNADDLMCELLRSLGYGEGVDLFLGMCRWYA